MSRHFYQFLHVKKAAFLAAFRENGNVRRSAEIAGVDRVTVYNWLEHDASFPPAFNLAKKDAVEALESEARRRAVEGVRKEKPVYYLGQKVDTVVETDYSDTLLIFLLKGADPDKYRERQDVHVTGKVDNASGDSLTADERQSIRELLTGATSSR